MDSKLETLIENIYVGSKEAPLLGDFNIKSGGTLPSHRKVPFHHIGKTQALPQLIWSKLIIERILETS